MSDQDYIDHDEFERLNEIIDSLRIERDEAIEELNQIKYALAVAGRAKFDAKMADAGWLWSDAEHCFVHLPTGWKYIAEDGRTLRRNKETGLMEEVGKTNYPWYIYAVAGATPAPF